MPSLECSRLYHLHAHFDILNASSSLASSSFSWQPQYGVKALYSFVVWTRVAVEQDPIEFLAGSLSL